MPSIFGTLLIGLIVAGVAVLAARSLWRNRKSACSCGGSCATCSCCAKGHSSEEPSQSDPSAE